MPPVSPPVENYAWLLSRLYLLLGLAPLTATLLSGLMGTIVVRNIYWATRLLANRSAALLIAVHFGNFAFVCLCHGTNIPRFGYFPFDFDSHPLDGSDRRRKGEVPFLYGRRVPGFGLRVGPVSTGNDESHMGGPGDDVLGRIGMGPKTNRLIPKMPHFFGGHRRRFYLVRTEQHIYVVTLQKRGILFFRQLNNRRALYVSVYRDDVGTTVKMAPKPDHSLGQFLTRIPLRIGEFLLSPFP